MPMKTCRWCGKPVPPRTPYLASCPNCGTLAARSRYLGVWIWLGLTLSMMAIAALIAVES